MGTSFSPWENAKNKMLGNNKAKRRRIDFVKSEAVTSFSTATIQQGKTPKNSTANANVNSFSKETKVQKKDEIAGPSPGLFPPERVAENISWKRMTRVGPGFFNHGNTCFLNATLQCLLHVPALTQIISQDKGSLFKSGETARQKTIFEYYIRFVEEATSPNCGRVISPRAMVQNIRLVSKQFRPMRQEDAHEYLRQLLDCMHEDILKSRGLKASSGKVAETTLISRVFGGYLCNELKCSSCQYSSKTYNHFQDISLDVFHGIKSVDDAVSSFIRPERLGSGNEWLCGGCNKKVQATKQMTIARAPNVLVLHLKRFSFGQSFGKVTKPIEYHSTLNLPCSQESSRTVPYSLHGIIVHHGGSVHSGHYVAFVKASNGEWHEMNDTSVRSVSVKTVMQTQAYVLFYVRTDVKAAQPTANAALTATVDKLNEPAKSLHSAGDSLKEKSEKLKLKWAQEQAAATGVPVVQSAVQPLSAPVAPMVKEASTDESSSASEEEEENGPQKDFSRTCRLPTHSSWIIRPFRFKGKMDPFFVRSGVPIGKLRKTVEVEGMIKDNDTTSLREENNIGEPDSDKDLEVRGSFLVRKEEKKKKLKPHQSDINTDADTDAESKSVPSPVESINVVKNGVGVTSETSAPPVKNVTLLRQLINLGKRGFEAGAEGSWDDDGGDSRFNQSKLAEITQKQNIAERRELGKRKNSEWNKMLDAGRTKKVKTPKPISGDDDASGGPNPFQRFEEENKSRKRF